MASIMKNKTVLISGAGVAGLALAYWLKRHGFVPTLVEKYPFLRTGGYKIDLRGVGLEVLKRMGICPAIVESRTAITHMIFVDAAGNQVTQMSADLGGTRLEGCRPRNHARHSLRDYAECSRRCGISLRRFHHSYF